MTRIRAPRTAAGRAEKRKQPTDWLSASLFWARAWLADVVSSTILAFCEVTCLWGRRGC